ncbi:hypothetical protein C7S16_4612 [Burkholderia thailandensis]|uniref:Uncharacterized protein n=1 Tax=Burkholderia thailandensis TaxID=57975 RepID=A0AAW9CP07_BURTH|nr:hypothetical protein [Burkholderia thailandensis]
MPRVSRAAADRLRWLPACASDAMRADTFVVRDRGAYAVRTTTARSVGRSFRLKRIRRARSARR